MFNVSVKNPLEAETLGERRERKSKLSEGSVLSSRSSLSGRDVESIRSSKFKVFGGFGKSSKAIPDAPLQITVTKTVDVSPYEPPLSNGMPSPPLHGFAPRPYSDGFLQESSSPSAGKSRAQRLYSSMTGDSPRNEQHELRPPTAIHEISTITTIETKPDSPVEPVQRIPTAELDVCCPSPVIERRRKRAESERPPLFRDTSKFSTSSTVRSEPIFRRKKVPEDINQHISGESCYSSSSELEDDTAASTATSTFSTRTSTASISSATKSVTFAPHDLVNSKIPTSVPPAKTATGSEPTSSAKSEPKRQVEQDRPSKARPCNASYSKPLRLIDAASNRVHFQRLNETWDGIELDLGKHIDFEKQLWAISGLKRLNETPNGKLSDSKTRLSASGTESNTVGAANGTQALYICDIGAESWCQAATNPQSTIHCLSPSTPSVPLDLELPPSGTLPNLDTRTWLSTPSLPFEDDSIDLISSRSMAVFLRSVDWPAFLRECVRVLKPGAKLELTVLDPMPRNAGPLLQQWTTMNLILGLERKFLISRPSMVIPFWLNDVPELEHLQIQTVISSAVLDDAGADNNYYYAASSSSSSLGQFADGDSRHRRQEIDVQQLRTAVCRHFYQAHYRDLAPDVSRKGRSLSPEPEGREKVRDSSWWWRDATILKECKEYCTMFEMVTYTCRKRLS